MERVAESTGPLEPKLVDVHAAVQPLVGEILELRRELGALRSELDGVSNVIDPLQSTVDRMSRIAERLPGGGS